MTTPDREFTLTTPIELTVTATGGNISVWLNGHAVESPVVMPPRRPSETVEEWTRHRDERAAALHRDAVAGLAQLLREVMERRR
ncbi:hypothetical protein AB0M47_20955 [Hamadaea sp. NPDC051192]|uniref:hypothetical protein n=1 Tax=Hamadaea sp. NPDC051192 TaxID=3154940 RepID=UPI003433D4FC